MRSSSLVCAAFLALGLGSFATGAHAADAKGKKKSASTDDSINKTLQWEDNVMGPDDKRNELEKIAKAQAINKAAQEKAAREKEKAEKEQAAREAKEAAAPKNQKKGGEVALPSMPDEEPASKSKSKPVEISPKLDTAEAAAPPPPSKPADDKFIDKLLKEEGSGKKKKASASANDKDLLDMLAGDKTASGKVGAKTKGKKSDVDNLLLEADKEPAPLPKVKHETPEWQKPEIQSTPVVAPVVVKQAPKRDDGIIHVVQGAAGPARPTTTTASLTTRTPAPAPSSRRTASTAPAAARGGSWDDPFADGGSRKTAGSRSASRDFDADDAAPASRRKAVASRRDLDDDDVTPAPRRNANAARSGGRTRAAADDDSWDDPFDAKRAPKVEKAPASTRRAVSTPAAKPTPPARGGAWKDPFTEDAPARPARGAVAMRDREVKDEGGGKWQAAAKHGSSSVDESGSSSSAHGGWGVIKKRR